MDGKGWIAQEPALDPISSEEAGLDEYEPEVCLQDEWDDEHSGADW